MTPKKHLLKNLSLWQWLLVWFALSVVVSGFYNYLSVWNEHRKRIDFSENLLNVDDAEAIPYFEKWCEKIAQDSLIFYEKTDDNSKLEWLRNAFDTAFLEDYTLSLTLCDVDEDLLLEDGVTVVDCRTFFEEKIQHYGQQTANKKLFEIRQTPFDYSYLSIVDFLEEHELFVEFVPKKKIAWLQNMLKKSRYSVAYYDRSDLVKQIGNFEYPLVFPKIEDGENLHFFEYEDFSHLMVFSEKSSAEKIVLISKRIPRIQNRLSVFSFVFSLSLILGLMILLLRKRTSNLLFRTFAQRLQVTILIIVLSTFLLVGITSIFYVQQLNSQKNQKVLREKTYSLLLLMELEFGNQTVNEISKNSEFLQQKMSEFSGVFFTDIFFYNVDGNLIAKSAIDHIFQGSSKNVMDANAYHQLSEEHRNFYTQKEQLSEQIFYSSYVPFRNYQNELLGYLNLPHIAKQTELRQEISAFMMAYVNLFVVLIIVVFLIVFLIVKRLTKPLVESERQMAWNEMAKQIAHEIKNPLTPMKLSVQQIQKAWKDQRSDFDLRMKKFSTMMVEQIDTLSTIASEFANFAQQTHVELTEVDVKTCLEHVILLMNSDEIIQFKTLEYAENTRVLAEEKQLSRALVNLLKNAKQAAKETENPQIEVSLTSTETHVVIAIQDNGKGIPMDIQAHIFEPNFTTKTSGMGLGLAITKNIVERFEGSISFETAEGATVFWVYLPKG